jgi:transcription elongation regulator 1
MSDRQEVFEEYCRDKARELRQAKQQAAAAAASNGGGGAGANSRSPEDDYRALLKQEVKSTRMRFDDFRKAWKKDRRFFGFGRDDREREKAFKAWLRELGEGE